MSRPTLDDPVLAFVATWQAEHDGSPCDAVALMQHCGMGEPALEAYLGLLQAEGCIIRPHRPLGGPADVALVS